MTTCIRRRHIPMNPQSTLNRLTSHDLCSFSETRSLDRSAVSRWKSTFRRVNPVSPSCYCKHRYMSVNLPISIHTQHWCSNFENDWINWITLNCNGCQCEYIKWWCSGGIERKNQTIFICNDSYEIMNTENQTFNSTSLDDNKKIKTGDTPCERCDVEWLNHRWSVCSLYFAFQHSAFGPSKITQFYSTSIELNRIDIATIFSSVTWV